MKKYLGIFFSSLIIACALTVSAFAQEGENHKPKSINERQANQKERIKDGVQDGDINKKELGRLAVEQGQIRRLERRLRTSDDEFTNRERVRVQHQLNQSSRHIRRTSRN